MVNILLFHEDLLRLATQRRDIRLRYDFTLLERFDGAFDFHGSTGKQEGSDLQTGLAATPFVEKTRVYRRVHSLVVTSSAHV